MISFGETTLVVDGVSPKEIAVWAVYSKLQIDAKESRLVGAWEVTEADLRGLHVWPPNSTPLVNPRARSLIPFDSLSPKALVAELSAEIQRHQLFFANEMKKLPKSKQRENPDWPDLRHLEPSFVQLNSPQAKDGALELARWLARFVDAYAQFEQQRQSRAIFEGLDQLLL